MRRAIMDALRRTCAAAFVPALSCLAAVAGLAALSTGCAVHEFPKAPESETVYLHLIYETDMTIWNHVYDGETVSEVGLGETYDNALDDGLIRYVVRAYPASGTKTKTKTEAQEYTQEFVFTRDLSESPHDLAGDYDYDAAIDLAPGDYELMVWSDLVPDGGDGMYYDYADFARITLRGDVLGDSDRRDAFRGSNTISIPADIMEHEPYDLEIAMERPLAKYEFVSTDLEEFIAGELTRAEAKAAAEAAAAAAADGVDTDEDSGTKSSESPDSSAESPDSSAESPDNSSPVTKSVDIGDYRAVIYYVGFMPCTYSMMTDKPVDSSTGDSFESGLSIVDGDEVSVGFDYVFVGGESSAVTVRIGLYDGSGEQISMTGSITVPLVRDRHTVIRGEFLTAQESGGVSISPGYDGDHNVLIP